MTRRIQRLAAGASFTSFLIARALAGDVVVSALPSGMLQLPAQATATDRFSLTNNGSAGAEVTLSASGGFFSAAPAAFTLPAGSTQIVTVTAQARSAGVHIGSIAATSPGSATVTVPVKLLVTQPPSAAVSVEPDIQRIEVAPPVISPAPPIPFGLTNRGTEAITALVVSDSSWIELLDDAVTIPAGRSYDVRFQINREKRPDAANPVGSATGRISLVFFSSTSSAGSPSVSLASVVVIDLNDPSLRTGTPPPLAGELAFFVPGFSAGVDLSMFAGGASPAIDDLRLYFARPPTGLPSSFAAFSRVATNSGISFVNIVPPSGGTQVRSSEPAALSLAAMRVAVDDGDPFTSLLPILRSDQGVPFAGTIFLAGVGKDATTRTDIHLQEVAGQPAFARIDYLDEAGLLELTLSYDLGPFESVHLRDAVPSGASTAVITNLSGGAARIAAVALVTDSRSGDSWAVTDATAALAAPATELLVPIISDDLRAAPVIHLVNRGSDVALTRVEVFRAAPGRRRAAKHSPAETNSISFALAPKAAVKVAAGKAAGGAYARITSAGGGVTASARTVIDDDRGSYGSPLPIFPPSAVLRAGQSRRFAGVDDAEPSAAAARTPLTFRSELMLVETSGQPARVRVRLRYVATAGLAIARATAEHELEIRGAAFVFLRPLARAIIGNGRDAFGDLRNMELTVEVIGGAGAVIPVLHSIENRSGDAIVRTE